MSGLCNLSLVVELSKHHLQQSVDDHSSIHFAVTSPHEESHTS